MARNDKAIVFAARKMQGCLIRWMSEQHPQGNWEEHYLDFPSYLGTLDRIISHKHIIGNYAIRWYENQFDGVFNDLGYELYCFLRHGTPHLGELEEGDRQALLKFIASDVYLPANIDENMIVKELIGTRIKREGVRQR